MNRILYSPAILRAAIAILPALLCAGAAVAQKDRSALPESGYGITSPAPAAAQKTTGTGSRLYTQTVFNVNSGSTSFSFIDSVTYYYAAPMGTMWDSGLSVKITSGALAPEAKYLSTYDASGRLLTYEIQIWKTSTSTYGPLRKTTYAYDASGNIADSVYQTWSTTTSAYVNSAHRILSYNATHGRTELILQAWNTATSAWLNKTRSVYNLNAQNSLLDDVDQTWNTSTSAWVNSYKTSYTYDATGLIALTELDQTWNTTTSTWQNSYRDVFTSDAAGRRLTDIYDHYNTTTSVWDKSGRLTYTYDAAGNRLRILYESYNTSSSAYVNSSLDSLTYNSYNQLLIQINSLGWVSGAWTPTTSSVMYRNTYETFHTSEGVAGVAGARISVWPVPAAEQLQLSLGWDAPKSFTAALTDMQGRVCQSIAVTSATAKTYSTTIAVGTLPAGSYILTVRDADGGTASRRVTVAH